MARISVIMGIFNCADTLPEAINSLFAQTYKDFQIIMCDDGSSDNTYEIAKMYSIKYNNIVLLRNESNKGLNYTLNRCLDIVNTEFIARMDGDDISMPDRFEIEVKFLDEHPEIAVVSTPCTFFDENGVFRIDIGKGQVKKEHFIHGSPISHAPCMARTNIFKEVGGYTVDDKLIRVEDYHLWFKIFTAGYQLYQMEQSKYFVRDNSNAIARRNWKARRNEMYVKHIGYKMIGLPWYFQFFAFKPIILYFLPLPIYRYLHKRK